MSVRRHAASSARAWQVSGSAFQLLLAGCIAAAAGVALAQEPRTPFEPTVGQKGKDVVWVPTPQVMVEKMLDMARVTPQDYVIDLGSGDGRNVIAAARRGARALGVEYNPDMVELSKRAAAMQEVSGKAAFVHGDMFEADISQATVLVLFLLPENLSKLAPKFLGLRPGTRIVSNTYEIGGGWDPDTSDRVVGTCVSWCGAHLYIVPARVAGTWLLPQGELTLEQDFQRVSGTFEISGISLPVDDGRLRGDEIQFTVNGVDYAGRVDGETIEGVFKGRATTGPWAATRPRP